MLPNRGYSAYGNNRVQTASQAELTLMLYDASIKFINRAIMAIEKNDIQEAHLNIMKTENIIEEFQIVLDRKYPVSKHFDLVYDYVMRRLIEANMYKDKEILEEVLGHMRVMRDTWKEVMRLTQNGSGTRVS